ncbi:MAG: polymerase [Solirubrobacteraceae bacterium]|nr:polymerase [Solirubrobacteraceae bacterium]
MRTVIAHLDLDAFYASVELLRHPELRGKPVIVSGSGPRAVVTTATYEARKFGVGSAMPTSRALRLCPNAVLVAPDFAAYKDASKRVWDIVRKHVETVEQCGLDEGYLDLTDTIAPKAAMRRLVSEIRAATGLSASIGIGPNKLVAKVCSDAEKPQGFVALSREMACERFADRSPGLIPGIGPKTVVRLEKLGLDTLGKLSTCDDELLVRTFGTNYGRDLKRRAQFHGSTTVVTERIAVSESRETTFDTDIADHEELEAQLLRLANQLCERLQRAQRKGRTIAIKVRLDDWTTVTRARTISVATNAEDAVSATALDLLREYAPARPVRLLGVRVASLEDPGDHAHAAQLRLNV